MRRQFRPDDSAQDCGVDEADPQGLDPAVATGANGCPVGNEWVTVDVPKGAVASSAKVSLGRPLGGSSGTG